jgi:hypothetical protein
VPVPDFDALRHTLLAAGIAANFAERTVTELEDHFEDLVDAGCADGLARPDAERRAASVLGEFDVLTAAVRRQPELRSWAWQWPRVAVVVYPLACLAALPMVPISAGIDRAPEIGRWLGGIVLAALVTATMLLVLKLSISPG